MPGGQAPGYGAAAPYPTGGGLYKMELKNYILYIYCIIKSVMINHRLMKNIFLFLSSYINQWVSFIDKLNDYQLGGLH